LPKEFIKKIGAYEVVKDHSIIVSGGTYTMISKNNVYDRTSTFVQREETGRDVKVSDWNLNITLHNISHKLEGNVKCSALLQNAPPSEKRIEGEDKSKKKEKESNNKNKKKEEEKRR